MIRECYARHNGMTVKVSQELDTDIRIEVQGGWPRENTDKLYIQHSLDGYSDAEVVRRLHGLAGCFADIAAQIESRMGRTGDIDDLLAEITD